MTWKTTVHFATDEERFGRPLVDPEKDVISLPELPNVRFVVRGVTGEDPETRKPLRNIAPYFVVRETSVCWVHDDVDDEWWRWETDEDFPESPSGGSSSRPHARRLAEVAALKELRTGKPARYSR